MLEGEAVAGVGLTIGKQEFLDGASIERIDGVGNGASVLGQSQGANSMSSVMGGIAEALVSTGVGLFLALPAVIAYNLLSKKVDTIDGNIQSITKHITAFLKAQHAAENTSVRRSVSVMERAG